MNKETRSFVWGIFLVVFCGAGVTASIYSLRQGKHFDFIDWVFFVLAVFATISGAIRIYNAVD